MLRDWKQQLTYSELSLLHNAVGRFNLMKIIYLYVLIIVPNFKDVCVCEAVENRSNVIGRKTMYICTVKVLTKSKLTSCGGFI